MEINDLIRKKLALSKNEVHWRTQNPLALSLVYGKQDMLPIVKIIVRKKLNIKL